MKKIIRKEHIWLKWGTEIQVHHDGKYRNGSVRKGMWVVPVADEVTVSVVTRRATIIHNIIMAVVLGILMCGVIWLMIPMAPEATRDYLAECKAQGGNTVKTSYEFQSDPVRSCILVTETEIFAFESK